MTQGKPREQLISTGHLFHQLQAGIGWWGVKFGQLGPLTTCSCLFVVDEGTASSPVCVLYSIYLPGPSSTAIEQCVPSSAPPGSESVYFGIWNPSMVQSANGLFQSLSACNSSSNIAITFNCQPAAKQQTNAQSGSTTTLMKSMAELESELAHILQGGSNQVEEEGSGRARIITFLPLYNVTEHRDLIPAPVWNLIENGNQVVSYTGVV